MQSLQLVALFICVLGLMSCGDDDPLFRANPEPMTSGEDQAVDKLIAQLAKGGILNDPTASVAFDEAVTELSKRGAKVESKIIDTLRSSPDGEIRHGCVEVLSAIASKAALPHLIAVLDDEVPLVAFRADITLRNLTRTRMIPEAGKPANRDLPAVPTRASNDVSLDADLRIWSAWHLRHRQSLKAAWERWWADNKSNFSLQ